MSKSHLILIILLIVSLVFGGYVAFEQSRLKKAKALVDKELSESMDLSNKQQVKIKTLGDELQESQDQVAKLRDQVLGKDKENKRLTSKVENLLQDYQKVKDERDKWQRRLDSVRKERDDIRLELKEQKEMFLAQQVAQKDDEAQRSVQMSTPPPPPQTSTLAPQQQTDQYWASVLREKADFEVRLQNITDELSRRSVELVELKQINADLQIELDDFRQKSEEINRDLKYKEDLINNLSLELARTKNDKKYIAERLKQLNTENTSLRSDVKKLIHTKSALEKSIVKLSQDKDKISRKLMETDTLIQSKIDEIWDIKESLDHDVASAKKDMPLSNNLELEPIVISKSSGASSGGAAQANKEMQGKVLSVNDENNFIIVDMGEKAGVKVGDQLSIYRDGKYLARINVIQTRKDISAADLQDKWGPVQPGDIVR